MKSEKIIIAGLAYNCSQVIEKNLNLLVDFGEAFLDYRLIVVENNSIDGTDEIIESFSSNEKIIYKKLDLEGKNEFGACENYSFSGNRIKKMAFLRNVYLREIKTINWPESVVFVVDLDLLGLAKEKLLWMYESSNSKKIVTAFGYSFLFKIFYSYHDTFALRMNADEKMSLLRMYLRKILLTFRCAFVGEIGARSAFGGAAVYRFEHLSDLSYTAVKSNDSKLEYVCEHVPLHFEILRLGLAERIVISTKAKIRYQ